MADVYSSVRRCTNSFSMRQFLWVSTVFLQRRDLNPRGLMHVYLPSSFPVNGFRFDVWDHAFSFLRKTMHNREGFSLLLSSTLIMATS